MESVTILFEMVELIERSEGIERIEMSAQVELEVEQQEGLG